MFVYPTGALNELYSVHFKRNKVRINIATTIPQELLKFTICVWIYPPRYETDGNIVSFSQNDTLVYFRILFKNTKLLFKMNEETVR